MKGHLNKTEINQEKSGTYIVLEAGPTHFGIESAKQLASIAKKAGANSVKFQTLYADRLMADKSINFGYTYLELDKDGNEVFVPIEEPLYEILKRRELSKAEWIELKQHCDSIGIHMFTTATYRDEVDFIVDELNIDSIKINSSDVNDLEFIEYCAKKGVNIQLDTGNADIWEIEKAVITAEEAGCDNIIIHHCPSGYPARLDSIHLKQIPTLKAMFPEHSIAFSDHTPQWDMDIAAVALGADMVEKTITLDRTIKSCEHSFSLEENDAIKFVKSIRDLEKALGKARRTIPSEVKLKRKATRRSPYAIQDLKAGATIEFKDFEFKRPGFGITSEEFDFFINKKLNSDIKTGEPLTYECI